MPVIPTSYLVAFVKSLLPDPSVVSDDEVVAALGLYETQRVAMPLAEEISPTGEVTWVGGAWWAEDVSLTDVNGTLTPSGTDLKRGRWRFADPQPGVVYATGYTYSPYLAAAWVLEKAVAALRGPKFNFSLGGDRVEVKGLYEEWLALAQEYRRRGQEDAEPMTIPLSGDEWVQYDGHA